MSEPTILHADLDAFFASVEQRDEPALRGRPVLVGGGVVMAASYEARAFGVRSAMGGRLARRLCPDAVVVPPRFAAYVAASKAVFGIFADSAPAVEALSIDEAFLDVSGLERISGTPPEIAARIRERVRREVGLPVSVGVARTRSLAKVASNAAKPDGLRVVEPNGEEAFLHPLPVEALWGVGPATARKLHSRGIRTVGDAAAVPEESLTALLGGAHGRHVHALARCRDPRPVRSEPRRRRSFGAQSARRYSTLADADAALAALVEKVTRRMRAEDVAGRTVVLRLRFGDFERATRSVTLAHPTAATQAVLAAGRELLTAARPLVAARGLTLVGVTVANLDDTPQLALELEGRADPRLDAALDSVRDRFGSRAVSRATSVGDRRRLQTWLQPGEELPD